MEPGENTTDQNTKESLTDIKTEHNEAQMSKNQLKKLRKKEKWLAIKQDKRRNAKLKRKLRLAEMRENGEDTGPTRKSLKKKSMRNSSCKIKVVIDLGLDDYMTEKDVNSLTCQLQHSYAANRRADNPLQLYFCGIGGKTKERLDKIGDYKGWDIYPDGRLYDEVFAKESLVYLSSESDNVLTNLSEDKVYVIGGLVDHNKHKGLCHRLAVEKGIAHAQLPISDYLDMKTRKVLTVNQVFSILLRYTETQDWKKSFMNEMPQRKQASAKGDAFLSEQNCEVPDSPLQNPERTDSDKERRDANPLAPEISKIHETADSVCEVSDPEVSSTSVDAALVCDKAHSDGEKEDEAGEKSRPEVFQEQESSECTASVENAR